MRAVLHIWRLIRTGATFERTGAMSQVLHAVDAPRPLRIALHTLAFPFRWLGYRGDPALPPTTRALTALGPAYIKFGQIISTRSDVIGFDLAAELRILQDSLPPFALDEARVEIARELGAPVDTLFSEISPAVAAASIAQVHRAVVRETGETVAIKVLRPGIDKAFRRDIDAFRFCAKLIETLAPKARRLRPSDVVDHFESVVQDELDLRIEGASASEFRAKTHDDPMFHVPKVHWDLSARRVLTMEWVEGIQAADLQAMDAAGIDRAALAQRLLQQFLRHALRDGLFHGDMHQGNLRIGPNGQIIALDFGIMGQLDTYTRRVYAEILYGFVQRDYRRVAEAHFEAGYVPADRDIDAFARALRAIGEPIFGMDASRMSMAKLLSQLFDVTERFGMQTRTELILLQRTMVVVEGVTRHIDPRSNIWNTSGPVIEDYVRDNIGPRAFLADLSEAAKVLARLGPRLPDLAERRVIAFSTPPQTQAPKSRPLLWALTGAVIALVGFTLGALLH
ncbi:2-polyprenylphenol 6-hydroxylase [Ketogulonicigenium vulgare]|uniref:Ubiquinone biosynthesis protein UbiB n=1 Tax=Ketogulonicigenium vulgare (strain WSH-001) TaxID=759362 RepID=F9Y4E6_KETVW|nr:2-polyprenylphenol 6-hydroxylase [Ketogulonicigenium vulgare]ADO43479.1 2-polyprenylphenol 6-hydroxylase [Ketogulonicigenium vulgare Y25]AEM41759.1 Ubiquinone biosynthesis protein UbiB [Ketogulonicigenium vulgare WSH-001]ALJ81867.1 2-octaprenylphenol hydroxylase [Ketogulonicigenium vulgare]ANW34517.1 2-polyprenylphenol 6-hydroxylase [Ketogulonicigenium vulgare]AOZ55515.1 ubiquinone biosynthesis protein UbiB [Ketogulonicigenium vulgare]